MKTKTFACGCKVEKRAFREAHWTPCAKHQPAPRESRIVKEHHDDPVPAFLLGYAISSLSHGSGESYVSVSRHQDDAVQFHAGGGEYGGAGASGSWDSGSSSGSTDSGSSGGDSGGGSATC